MGRPPKPDHMKALAGNPGRRKLRGTAPAERPQKPPAPPRHLKGCARTWWTEHVPVLLREGKLTTLSLPALEMVAQAYGTWRAYEAQAAEVGPLQAVHTGLRTAADRARAHYVKFMSRFGGDPQSAGTLRGLPPPPDDGDAEARSRREKFFGVPGGRGTDEGA